MDSSIFNGIAALDGGPLDMAQLQEDDTVLGNTEVEALTGGEA